MIDENIRYSKSEKKFPKLPPLKLKMLDKINTSQNGVDINDFGSKTTTNRSLFNSNNKVTLDSEDLFIKKKFLINSNNNVETPSKRDSIINDNLITDTGKIIPKNENNKSQNRRRLSLKLIQKHKFNNKKDLSSRFIEFSKENENQHEKERRDIYGNIINKKNKKNIRVSFVDRVTNQPLAKVIEIESFRKYNYIVGMPKEENMKNITSNCQCCYIF